MPDMTPSELDALAAKIADRAAERRELHRAVREMMNAATDAMEESRKSKIFDAGYRSGIAALSGPLAQSIADGLMADLAAKGMLRDPTAVKVSRVKRDKKGRIRAVVETEE